MARGATSNGTSTASLHLHYLRAVTGGTLLAEGRVVQSGRWLSFAEVDIRDAETDRSVARGSGTFVIAGRGGLQACRNVSS